LLPWGKGKVILYSLERKKRTKLCYKEVGAWVARVQINSSILQYLVFQKKNRELGYKDIKIKFGYCTSTYKRDRSNEDNRKKIEKKLY
jgi:hypothetical protein